MNGLKPTFYADDTNDAGHALRTGMINCTPLTPQPAPTAQPTAVPTATPMTNPPPQVNPAPVVVAADHVAPKVTLALKLARTSRRTGAFTTTITLSERATLTITAKSGKRTLLKTTRSGAVGKATLKLKVKRNALRKGQKLTLTVQARDAAGNVSTTSATAKIG